MPRLVWVSTTNPSKQYITTINNDPNVPTGYVLSNTSDGSCQCVDGKTDQNLQVFVGGLASGGFDGYNAATGSPGYSGYTDGSGSGKWPNGHLGGD